MPIVDFIKQVYNKTLSKLKESLPILLDLFLVACLAILTLFLIICFAINYLNLFIIIVSLILLILIFSVIISKNIRNYLKRDDIQKNIQIFSWFSILFAGLSILLVIIINITQESRSFKDIKQFLLTENELNQKYAKNLLEDEEKKWFYWKEFSLLNYKPNLNYIMRYNNEECQVKYFETINAMEVTNNANRALINLGINKILILTQVQLDLYNEQFNNLKDLIKKNASTTYNNIDYIIRNCN